MHLNKLRKNFEIADSVIGLPANVLKAFVELGENQRGKPESTMVKVQFCMGGGVLNPLVEHVGDLTNRMTAHLRYSKPNTPLTSSDFGLEMVSNKVNKTLLWINNPYGFEKEMENNIKANALYRQEKDPYYSEINLVKELNSILDRYAKEHAKLKVYNYVQWLGRQSAIEIGKQNWNGVRKYLKDLKKIVDNENEYVKQSSEYMTNSNGNLITFHL